MNRRISVCLAVLALALAVAGAQPAVAAPVHYGTGIYHWVLSCGPFPDGHSTSQYVGSSVCPNHPPTGCTCTMTTYDFPYNNPYPYLRINTGTDPNDPGTVHVLLDTTKAIQCGVTVAPCSDHGTCGDPFNSVPASATQIDPRITQVVESLRSGIEEQTGAPVGSFTYSFAVPVP